jgi:hypothetical protein
MSVSALAAPAVRLFAHLDQRLSDLGANTLDITRQNF